MPVEIYEGHQYEPLSFLLVLMIEPSVLHMFSKYSTIKLHCNS